KYSFPDGLRNREQVLPSAFPRRVIHHHMELGRKNQDSDSGKHPVNNRRSDRAEQLSGLERARRDLQQPSRDDDWAQARDPILLDELVNDDGEPRGRPAYLERTPGK